MSPARSAFLTHNRKQNAVYWGNPGNDGFGGRTFDAAVELDPDDNNGVRWEERHEMFIDAEGREKRSMAVVHTAQDVDIGGYLYLGDADDLDSDELADPLTVDDAYEIRGFKKVPDVKGTKFVRKAWL